MTRTTAQPAVAVSVGVAPAPDLVVDTPTVDASAPAAGARFSLSAKVRNEGNGSSAFTTLRYYQSSDSSITSSDTSVGTDSVSSLDASESGDESISLTAPSTPGTYYYGACVDSVSDELDTTNNCSVAVTVTVGAAPAPDLLVDTPTVSEGAPEARSRFTLSATVRNQGNGSSAFSTLRYYQSTDSAITTGDTEVGTDSVTALNSSGSGDESVSLTAPSTPGTYYYGACVDAVTDELDTQNNCSAAVTLTVDAAPAPDLVVDTPTISEGAPEAGASFTLNATVRNQGNGSSAFTTLRYYQSTDLTITSSDTSVGTDSVSSLDASESGDEWISLTAPSTPGTYYYGACVDSVSDELDTTKQLFARGDCNCRRCACAGPCGRHAHGGRQRSGSGSALHAERQCAQPGQWSISVRVHHLALLPFHRFDNHHRRHGSRHGLGVPSRRIGERRRVDQPDRAVHTWDVLLRRVRRRGYRGVRHDEQLLRCGDRNGWRCTCTRPSGGRAHCGRQRSGSGSALHVECQGAQPG